VERISGGDYGSEECCSLVKSVCSRKDGKTQCTKRYLLTLNKFLDLTSNDNLLSFKNWP
jgi:hypothetical protein